MREPKYPNVQVQLSGRDGNAVAIIGRVTSALVQAGVSRDVISLYVEEATSGDYENVLATTDRWVTVL